MSNSLDSHFAIASSFPWISVPLHDRLRSRSECPLTTRCRCDQEDSNASSIGHVAVAASVGRNQQKHVAEPTKKRCPWRLEIPKPIHNSANRSVPPHGSYLPLKRVKSSDFWRRTRPEELASNPDNAVFVCFCRHRSVPVVGEWSRAVLSRRAADE